MTKKKKSIELVSGVVLVKEVVTKTVTVNDIRKTCQHIGDSLTDNYNKTQDMKAAAAAVSAYGTAIAAVKAQLIYKKMTGAPGQIAFLEAEN